MAVSRQSLAPMLLTGVLGNSVIYIVPLLIGAIVTDRGYTEQQAGFMASADLAGYALATIASAVALGRLNWRRIALAGVALMLVANIVTTFVHGITAFAAIRCVSGLGSGLLAAIATVALGQTGKPDRAYGLFYAACLFFGAAGLWGLPPLLERFGLNVAYWLVAGFALLVGFAVNALPLGHAAHVESQRAAPVARVLPALAVLASICIFFTEQNAVFAYAERIGNRAGLSAGYIGFSLGMAMIVGFVGAASVAWAGSRFGRLVPLAMATVLQLLCIFALAGFSSPWVFLASVSVLALSWNVANPLQLGVLAEVDPSGRALALAATVTGVGLAAGPALGAMVIGEHRYGALLSLAGVLAVVSLLLILPALSLIRLRLPAGAS